MMKYEEMEITPEVAAEMLKFNTMNRPLSKVWVNQLAGRMERDEWKYNAETITFADDGTLLDGQHRLSAVVKSGVTIKALVVRGGVKKSAFDTMGGGKPRGGSDVFAIKNIPNAAVTVAALRWVDMYLTERTKSMPRYSNTQLLALYDQHPGISASAAFCPASCSFTNPSILVCSHYLFSKLDKVLADSFVLTLCDGFGLQKGDPVAALRNRLIKDEKSKSRLAKHYAFALTIKAWNMARKGVRADHIFYRDKGSRRISSYSITRKNARHARNMAGTFGEHRTQRIISGEHYAKRNRQSHHRPYRRNHSGPQLRRSHD
jgi:hypothetical protein